MQDFTTADGCRIVYADEGRGLPVVALAGLTRDHRDFDYLSNHLRDVRLIRPDARGRGRSDRTGPDSYTVPRETADVIDLLDHLGIERAAIIGTSRGGLLGMVLNAMAPGRLLGLCLNDVGPELNRAGLERIGTYLGVRPTVQTLEDLAERMAAAMPGFQHVPQQRWVEEVVRHYTQDDDGVGLTYDPALRRSFDTAMAAETPDLWPLFDLLEGVPLALIRGANSDILTAEVAGRMRARRPDMTFAEVPHRGHVPFLDEPEALAAIGTWLDAVRKM